MPCPREVGDRTTKQLALTFGTLLSSQRTDAHPWKSLDRLRGNLIYATGWPRQFQIVAACRIPTPWQSASSANSGQRSSIIGGVPWAVQLRWIVAIRPLCGSPWGMDEVTG